MIDIGKAKALSVILFLIYWYVKTKEKIPLYCLCLISFIVFCVFIFKQLFPTMEFLSPTTEYLSFLVIVGVPFLFVIYRIGMMFDKMTAEQKREIFRPVFETSKSNIVFYSVIAIILLSSYLMGNSK
jgi:hypothetical protein